MKYDSHIWGPHFWFFLHTLAYNYPLYPNSVTKTKYYDFIMNLPLFIPDEKMSNQFSKLLDKYPVTPYLDKRDSFIQWMYFIHNKINVISGKKEISREKATRLYFDHYKPKKLDFYGNTKIHNNIVSINMAIILALCIIVYVLYK